VLPLEQLTSPGHAAEVLAGLAATRPGRKKPTVDGKERGAVAMSALLGTLMTLQEVADHLRVGRSTIYRLLKRNQMPAFRIGRNWRFNVEEIDEWCESHGLERQPKPDV
jgi:excisionase family DNA binding protein